MLSDNEDDADTRRRKNDMTNNQNTIPKQSATKVAKKEKIQAVASAKKSKVAQKQAQKVESKNLAAAAAVIEDESSHSTCSETQSNSS